MQSYEAHIVSEDLDKRHPYLQEPFTSEINPKQVGSLLIYRLPKQYSIEAFLSMLTFLSMRLLRVIYVEMRSRPSTNLCPIR